MVAVVRAGHKAAKAQPRRAAPVRRSKAKTPAPAAKLRAGKAAGLPPKVAMAAAGLVVLAGASIFLFTGGRLQAIAQGISMGAARQMAAIGFKVVDLNLQGVTPAARADVLAAAAVTRDQPILAIDLEGVRQRVEAVGWVEEARVVRLLPSTLLIHVDQRPPVAVWQNRGVVQVVDSQGRIIEGADPAHFPALPFLVGEGAGEAARLGKDGGILSLIAARPRLAERLEALVRVDQRRWDLRLKDGAIVQLPAVGEDSALIQLDKLDQGQRLLELGFERIDLRTPEMVVVRRREGVVPGQLLAGGV